MLDDFSKPQMSGPDYGRSLTGIGFNLIVRDIERAIAFAREVLGADVFFRTDVFAAMRLSGQDFMFHTPLTYRNNELYPTLVSDAPRGVGIELRCYHVDPDAAEAQARLLGFTVLAGTIDKGNSHGLRECMILDDDGFVWIPSRHVKPDA
jgi:catechol 2,3-dioxygenase-like lactoylglutathione lyase family enzyme